MPKAVRERAGVAWKMVSSRSDRTARRRLIFHDTRSSPFFVEAHLAEWGRARRRAAGTAGDAAQSSVRRTLYNSPAVSGFGERQHTRQIYGTYSTVHASHSCYQLLFKASADVLVLFGDVTIVAPTNEAERDAAAARFAAARAHRRGRCMCRCTYDCAQHSPSRRFFADSRIVSGINKGWNWDACDVLWHARRRAWPRGRVARRAARIMTSAMLPAAAAS